MPGRALSFGVMAEAYERFRPGYPVELFDLVMTYAGQPVLTALEIGAGTGKATRLFAQRGVTVTATEPDGAMLAELLKHVPASVRTVQAAFEDVRPGESYGLVYAAAALHWTNPQGRWSRVAALLEPGGGFEVMLADGPSRRARRILAATGLVDEYPDIPGLRDRWGRDVVHCPFCFGWELRDQPLAVLATGPQAAAQALMWRQWSEDVALFLHTAPQPGPEQLEQLAARGISVIEGEVTGVEVTGDRLSGVRLRSGRLIPRRAVVIGPQFEARHALLDSLGAGVAEHPLGIGHQVGAAAAGVTAAAAINADLTAEDTAAAVAARAGDSRHPCAGPLTAVPGG